MIMHSVNVIIKHEVIDPQIDAYRNRNLEAFASFYTPNIVVLRNGQPLVNGISAFKEFYKAVFESSPQLTLHISERKVEGSYVIDTEHIRGLRGDPSEVRAEVRYKVEDGKIVEVKIENSSSVPSCRDTYTKSCQQ